MPKIIKKQIIIRTEWTNQKVKVIIKITKIKAF